MGFQKEIRQKGDDKTYPRRGQNVTVHYRGRLTNGKQFDSSIGGKPFTFKIGMGQVIRGWDEGVATMCLGEVSTFVISSDYGYGFRGAPPDIPPNATLIFDVQLLNIH